MTTFSTNYMQYGGSYLRYKRSDGYAYEYKSPPFLSGLGVSRIRDLNSNPNWKTDVAKKRDASRPYRNCGLSTNIKQLVRFNYTSGTAPSVTTEGFFVGSSPVDSLGIQPYDDTLRDIALSRIKRKLATQTKVMQGIVPIVEIRELRQLIQYLTKQTTTFAVAALTIMKDPLNTWKYRNLGKAVVDFKIWEAWLAYSFAIKPTLSDIDNAVQAIQNYLGDPPRSIVLRGTAKKEWTSRRQFYSGFYGVGSQFGLDNVLELSHTLTYTYVAGLNINLLSSNTYYPPGQLYSFPAFLDQFGLTPEKLAGSVWELIPFSWLIDYFGTVGAFLDDAFESPASNTRYCTLSRKYNVTINRSSKILGSGDTKIGLNKISGGFYEYYDFERTVHTKLPHRSLRFKTADEIGANGVNRLLNLLAVLASGSGRPIRG